jgi:hypothetical protein
MLIRAMNSNNTYTVYHGQHSAIMHNQKYNHGSSRKREGNVQPKTLQNHGKYIHPCDQPPRRPAVLHARSRFGIATVLNGPLPPVVQDANQDDLDNVGGNEEEAVE